MTVQSKTSAVVVGAGPAGLATALALAHEGVETLLVGPPANAADGRTAALFQGSVQFLKAIGAWAGIERFAEPITAIRLADATNSAFRAPEVTFDATEIGYPDFGYNVPTGALTVALDHVAGTRIGRLVSAGVTRLETSSEGVLLETAEGPTLTAKLVAAADGRSSLCRRSAGIETRAWSYPQAALVATFSHTRPHKGVSTELHRRPGPLTIVPMPGNASSLVWVEEPGEAERLAALSDSAFIAALEPYLAHLTGTLSGLSPRRLFQLSGQTASVLGQNRVALIGEAGHVIPPIGAQGLNLSFRDAAMLAELAGNAFATGRDIGSDDVLGDFDRRRRPDITARVWSIDLMNRSLLSEYAPVHFARGLGLCALKTISPLRHLVMREGMTPSFATPRLMREPAASPQSTP